MTGPFDNWSGTNGTNPEPSRIINGVKIWENPPHCGGDSPLDRLDDDYDVPRARAEET